MRKVFLFSIVIIFVGCIKEPAEYWQINKPRILAIKAYSPQITDEAFTLVEALAFSPSGPIVDVSKIKWLAVSVKNVSLYSRGEEKMRLAGFFLFPEGPLVVYFPPSTTGTYWVGAYLDGDTNHISLKQIDRVNKVDNRNPEIEKLTILPSHIIDNDLNDLSLKVDAYDPDSDKLTFSWFVVNGKLSGCTKSIEKWTIKGLSGYNQIFVVARDRKGGIDWKMGEIFIGKNNSKRWAISGGVLYPLPATIDYPTVFTYSVKINRDKSQRGFHIDFIQPVTTDDAITLDRWYLGFVSCNPCNMRFRILK